MHLYYGLCQQQSIAFGRPSSKREHRLYFVERIFDYSPIIEVYIRVNQEIVCDVCGHKFGSDQLAALEVYDMLCPECKKGICRVVNISRKYENLIKQIAPENLLPETELGILQTLHTERKQMFAKELAGQLDCSYQMIGRRGKHLAERDLVTRDKNEDNRRVFYITSLAQNIYFDTTPDDEMFFEE